MSTITEKLRTLVSGHAETGGPVQAVWNGAVIAESDRTVVVEGNHSFPPQDVHSEYLEPSSHRTVCPWKSTASYYDVVVDGGRNKLAARYYPVPKRAAAQIHVRVAFWHGVKFRRAPAQ